LVLSSTSHQHHDLSSFRRSIFPCYDLHHPDLPSFPPRRSSGLWSASRREPPLARGSTSRLRSSSASRVIPRRWTSWSCAAGTSRSEEHTSELQSRENLVCRLLLDKTNTPHPTPRESALDLAHS